MNVVKFMFNTMYLVPVSFLLWTGLMVNSETHSLFYIYTALSKPVGLPGIHQFSAMGLLDGRMIDYFDSEHQKKVPKQDWMKERLDPDYWVEGTQSRLRKQQWFKDNIDILMKRMRQNDSDVHVLQWMHGCEGDRRPDGTIRFRRGMDRYGYDGNDFLVFDDSSQVWVAPSEAGLPTKRKWDGVEVLKEYTMGYLRNECMDWLRKFVDYGKIWLQKNTPPEVYMFSKNTMSKTKVMLTCLATGFYPKDIILKIKRNGHVLTREDGVFTFGVRPNDDDTFQRRDSLEILKRDMSTYTCEVNNATYATYKFPVETVLDHTLPESGESKSNIGGVLAGLFVVLVVTIGVLLAVLYKQGVFGAGGRGANNAPGLGIITVAPTATSSDSLNSSSEAQSLTNENEQNAEEQV